MTIKEIIDGLKFTVDMFLFNPSTGEVTDKNRLTEESRLTVDACEGAIKALEQESILDKIRAEIDKQEKWLLQAGCTACNVDIAFDAIKSVVAESEE